MQNSTKIKMINVQISTASGAKPILTIDTPLKVHEFHDRIEELTNISQENYYIVHNGKLVDENDTFYDGYVSLVPRLLGGKGGFGSMLRAIGAQIEKTTNREACRDLSGRRLRDINEEKRLKAWIERQGKREEEAAERKKKKLERLCAEPRHEFKDHTYERERSTLTEKVGDAVEEGFKAAGMSGVKRKHVEEVMPNRKKTLLDLDIDSDELDSSEDSEEDEIKPKKINKDEEQISHDSGHSSDETGKVNKNSNDTESEYSEASSDKHISNENLDYKNKTKEDCVVADSIKSMDECIKRSE